MILLRALIQGHPVVLLLRTVVGCALWVVGKSRERTSRVRFAPEKGVDAGSGSGMTGREEIPPSSADSTLPVDFRRVRLVFNRHFTQRVKHKFAFFGDEPLQLFPGRVRSESIVRNR